MKERFLEAKGKALENTYITLPELFYSRQLPSKVPSPEMIIWNEKLGQDLGLDTGFFKSEEGVAVLSGNKVLAETTPIAQAYAGHQFG